MDPKKGEIYCFFLHEHNTGYKTGYMKLPRRTSWYTRSTTPRPERGYSEAKVALPARPQAGRAAGLTCSPGVWEEMRAYALVHPVHPG